MAFFRDRNKIQTEYSGYEDATTALRGRLASILEARSGHYIGLGNEQWYLELGWLDHEIKVRMNKTARNAILAGAYDEVFETVEILLALIRQKLFERVYNETLDDVATALRTSGSVYGVNQQGQIILQIPKETAESISDIEEHVGARSAEALDFFRRALHDLLARERSANDIVKDFAVAMEDYITALAGKKDFGAALRALCEQGIIAPTQQGVLDKLYAYRGDAQGVAHPGNTKEPGGADAMWFLETMVAQVKMIEAKIKTQAKKS